MTEQELNDLLNSAGDIPELNSNADVRTLLASAADADDAIMAIHDYVGRLCDWGEELEKLTEPQKNFFFNQIFEIEMNNGGISQYFFNAGQYAHETLAALSTIGAARTAAILEKAIGKFPKATVPKDDDKRENALDKIEEAKGDEVWDDLEDEFYEYADNLNELNLAYIKQNIGKF